MKRRQHSVLLAIRSGHGVPESGVARSHWRRLLLAGALLGLFPLSSGAAAAGRPFTVEYYYKVKWGHFNEFLELYKKNHYPVLAGLKKKGVILEMRAAKPRYHSGEDGRWDFRFVIVWRDAATALEGDHGEEKIIQELYPDQETFRQEEKRRFELLLEHRDVPIEGYDLAEWKPSP